MDRGVWRATVPGVMKSQTRLSMHARTQGSHLRCVGLVARGMWDLSSSTRDQTHIPCIRRWVLNHWTTREVPPWRFLNKGGITWYPQEDCVKQEESGPGPEMLRLRTLEGFCAWVTGTTRKQFRECAEASVQC